MDKYGNMTRREACYFLGIKEDDSEEQIKRAYRYKAKLYHPDANPNTDTKEHYLKIQKAYECLMNSTGQNPVDSQPRPDVSRSSAYAYNGMNMGTAQNNGAYGYNPYTASNMYKSGQPAGSARQAKVFASTASTRANYQRQKAQEKEHQKIQKWDKEYKSVKKRQQQEMLYGKEYTDKALGEPKGKEEEILEKIRAIWLAETIKRQIALDKENKEMLQRRKLYQAFMQQDIQGEDSGWE